MTDTNVSLDDVLDALMLEELEPTHAALARWCKRYPQYRDELSRYFATWSRQKMLAEDPETERVQIDEEKMAARAVKHAFELAGRQGRFAGGDPAESVSPFDQLVLTAVYLLRGAGYSVSITGKVGEMSGKQVVLGSTFGSLGRLERGGLVTARLADPQTEPEHKGRRYFTVTLTGERVLAAARATSRIVADFLGDFA